MNNAKNENNANEGKPVRAIWQIANEIRAELAKAGKPCPVPAKPYLDGMLALDKVTDNYGFDSAHMIIAYFLGNSKAWKGENANKLKNELRRMIGQKETTPKKKKASSETAEQDSL